MDNDYLKYNYLDARHKHEYDPKHSESSYSFEQIKALRDMAENDVYPDIRFSDEECNIWSMFHRNFLKEKDK